MDLIMSYKLQNNLQPFHLKVIKEENNVRYTTTYNDDTGKKQGNITLLERDVTCTRCGQTLYWCNCNILKDSTEIQTS